MYGKHIEDKFGYKFYVPSVWEGTFLFKNPAPTAPKEFARLGFIYAGGSIRTPEFNKNKKKVDEYNKKQSEWKNI